MVGTNLIFQVLRWTFYTRDTKDVYSVFAKHVHILSFCFWTVPERIDRRLMLSPIVFRMELIAEDCTP